MNKLPNCSPGDLAWAPSPGMVDDLTMGFPQEVAIGLWISFFNISIMISMFFFMAVDYNCRYGLEVLCSVKKGKPELRKKVLKGVWGPKLHLAGKHLVDTGVVKLLNF